jgi:hypothetical protein
MTDLGILKNCRHRHFTWKLHHLINTVEFTVVCLQLSMHDVVIRLAEWSITMIYFSPYYLDPKYLGSLGRLEVFSGLKEIIRVAIIFGQGCIILYFLPVGSCSSRITKLPHSDQYLTFSPQEVIEFLSELEII